MTSISSFGIVVISGFLLICHFCTFVSCQETQETCKGNGCIWNDEQLQCNCPEEERENQFLIRNERAKKDRVCRHHDRICISNGDPHFTTFNGSLYHLYKYGVYTLVQLTTCNRSLWIQAKHVPWHADGSRSVNCGVMAREGNSIIGIINCNPKSPPLIVKYQLHRTAPSGSIRTLPGRGWKIILVSGIEIEVIRWDYGKFMHVHVKGLMSEFTQYTGLCSVTNVPHNSECPDWNCDQYRVNDSDSFFNIPQGNVPACGKKNHIRPQCFCNGTYPHCADPEDISIKSTIKCNKNSTKTGTECDKENDGDLDEMVDRGLNVGYGFFGRVRDLNPKPVANVEDGRIRCNDALKLSPTYELCSSKVDASTIIESCALDENTMKEDGPAKSIPTEFETVCLDNIRLSIEADANSQELKDLLAQVEKLVCPSQCSQNGKCVDSKCQCNEGFTGTDCSQGSGQASVVQK